MIIFNKTNIINMINIPALILLLGSHFNTEFNGFDPLSGISLVNSMRMLVTPQGGFEQFPKCKKNT